MPDNSVARILVVDDEPALRELLIDALSGDDMAVSAAASGEEALEIIRAAKVDFIVTDFRLGGCSGLDVLDELQTASRDIPAVLITGHGSAETFCQASRRRPVELMTKPIDVDRLRATIRSELARRRADQGRRWRTQRIRRAAHRINRQRKFVTAQLENTCAELADTRQSVSGQINFQSALLSYQHELIAAGNDDDVFRALFRLFVRQTGPLFGVTLLCDEDAELRVAGRFGVPQPDGLGFCEKLAWPIVEAVTLSPKVLVMDLSEDTELFDESIRKYLAGVTVLAVPLRPAPGEMIGLALLYRKGEQPFTEADVTLAGAISNPTALAIRRNG